MDANTLLLERLRIEWSELSLQKQQEIVTQFCQDPDLTYRLLDIHAKPKGLVVNPDDEWQKRAMQIVRHYDASVDEEEKVSYLEEASSDLAYIEGLIQILVQTDD